VDRPSHTPPQAQVEGAQEEQNAPRRWLRPFGFRRSFVASVAIHGTLLGAALALGLGPMTDPGRIYFRTSMAFERPESSVETWIADVEPPREPQTELPPEPELVPVEPSEPDPLPDPEPEPELADPEDVAQVWASVSLDPLRRMDPPEIEEESSAPETPADAPRPVELADAHPDPVVAEPQVTHPVFRENPPPHYPRVAHRLGQEGVVQLRIEVAANGRVIDVTVQESSGYRLLDKAALDAVREWRFYPATENGVPVAWTFDHAVRFRIDDVEAY
jgi:protein TonB